jgi:hypothetical protein
MGHKAYECTNLKVAAVKTVVTDEPASDPETAWFSGRYDDYSNSLANHKLTASGLRVGVITNKTHSTITSQSFSPNFKCPIKAIESHSTITSQSFSPNIKCPITESLHPDTTWPDQVRKDDHNQTSITNDRDGDRPHLSRNIPDGYKLRTRTTATGSIRETLVSIASIQRRRERKKLQQIPKTVDKIQLAHPDKAMLFTSNYLKVPLEVLGDTGASANVTSRDIANKTNDTNILRKWHER